MPLSGILSKVTGCLSYGKDFAESKITELLASRYPDLSDVMVVMDKIKARVRDDTDGSAEEEEDDGKWRPALLTVALLAKLQKLNDHMEAGFIFGHLARDPLFDNVTRRHRYSWGPSGFCEWRRGGVIFYRFVLEEKGPFGFLGGRPQPLKKPSQKVKRSFFSRKRTVKKARSIRLAMGSVPCVYRPAP